MRFKTAEFNWIGRIDSLVNMVFLWHTSPVKTFADAQKTESKLSGTGVGSTVSVYPTVTNNVLGTKFKLIMGYKGSNEAQLAVERGEVDGHSTSWTAVKVGASGLVAGQEDQRSSCSTRSSGIPSCRRADRGRTRPQRRGARRSLAR